MKQFTTDVALYQWVAHGILRCMSGSYVYDLIRCGDKDFRELPKKTSDRFEMTDESKFPIPFKEFVLENDEGGSTIMDHNNPFRKLECLPGDSSFSMFRSVRRKITSIIKSLPDCLSEISRLVQVAGKNLYSAKGKSNPKAQQYRNVCGRPSSMPEIFQVGWKFSKVFWIL